MYQRILVPLDGSAAGEEVLPYAEEIAGRLGSQIILACVTESPQETDNQLWSSYLEKMVAATRHGAKDFIPEGEKRRIKVSSALLSGNPAQEIIEYADKQDISLILMSARGESAADTRWNLGSVADKVLRATTRPVALIRIRGTPPDRRNITRRVLVPLDGSKCAEQIIPYVQEFAAKRTAEIFLLQVVEASYGMWSPEGYSVIGYGGTQVDEIKSGVEKYLKSIELSLKKKGLRVKTVVRVGVVADEIIKAADDIKATIVAMTTHGRTGLTRWAFGSVTDRVLHGGYHPMILVRCQPD